MSGDGVQCIVVNPWNVFSLPYFGIVIEESLGYSASCQTRVIWYYLAFPLQCPSGNKFTRYFRGNKGTYASYKSSSIP